MKKTRQFKENQVIFQKPTRIEENQEEPRRIKKHQE